ncbi:DUF4175 family protein [Ekhidna sp.]
MSGLEEIKSKIASFKRRFYLRQTILGVLGFLILNSSVFFLLSTLEHQFWLGVVGRSILFFGFLLFLIVSAYLLLAQPILMFTKLRKGLSDEQAAVEISKHFPEIEDKLINALQLSKQENQALLNAAIEKKSAEFKKLVFIQAVDFRITKKYGLLLLLIATAFVLVSFINPSLITDSSNRIVNFKKEFIPEAPFSFKIKNEKLKAFRGEDFSLNVDIEGDLIPEYVNIFINGKSTKQIKITNAQFSYTFQKIQSQKDIYFEGAGFQSKTYNIEVHDRPDLVSLLIRISEPPYAGGLSRTVENTGDLTVLEGSQILWEFNTLATDSAHFTINGEKANVSRTSESWFAIDERVMNDGSYQIDLFNRFSQNKSELTYSIDVIKDEYPDIIAQYFPDSITYESISIAGSVSDDYGFTGLFINYRKQNEKNYTKIPLEINKKVRSQSYYVNWSLDTLNINPGQSIEMYISVKDNDGVHGAKETKANSFILKAPSLEDINAIISEKESDVEDQLGANKEKAEEIADRLEEIEERLKSEQKFDWQEKKVLNDIIEDREALNKQIEELKKKHEDLLKSNKQFNKQSSQLQNKSEKLQELIDQLMDEETRKLYEKLKELMKENSSSDEISQQVNELKKNEQNLERDLERTLELFKRLKMETALEQNLQELDTLSQKQENASEKELDKDAQEKINDEFDEFREKMDEIQDLNQDLKRPEAMEDFELEERQIAKELREIMDEMKKNEESDENEGSQENSDENQGEEQQEKSQKNQKSNNTQQKQKNASQKMKKLSKKLSKMQGGMQMEMMQANLDELRDILDNLIKLSFNQEEIMLEMRQVNQSDPRFLELSQNQLKLKDDAKVIQDSLLSLASKVVQISSFVTREVGSINDNIDEAIDYLKDRNRGRALSSQQFAMTSINNLALLLDDTMQQMQMSMSESMGNSSGQKQKPQGMPDLQEMQNQLGEKINELKGSGKSGRQLSEDLARLAAEQEMIRQQMQMLKESQDGKPGGGLGGDELKKAIDMMEQNEVDLVNKRLTRQLINRQKQIMTRMLEAEKAQRNQEMEEEREAQKPSIISREMPPGFEKYLELRKKEIELLKTIPLEFNQFYKKEVNDYFRRLSTEEKE